MRHAALAIWLGLAGAACAPDTPPDPASAVPAAAPPTHVGSEVCAGCHRGQYEAWRNSHHDLAMQEPTARTVLGNFDDARFDYGDVVSTFSREDGRFVVHTDGPDGELSKYAIAYTIGVDPLQQYLVEFPDGRLQALSIVWDTRSAESGGQRWLHLYPDNQIDHKDPLHWTGPLQNWNFMCAECHSTRVRKRYEPDEDRFATEWAEIDVACEACHGPGSAHVSRKTMPVASDASAGAGLVALMDAAGARWVMNAATGIARRDPPRHSAAELETCARCHSRRAMFSEDYVHGAPLMGTHRPALLTEYLYHADGQILDEVYVYGSFLQSAMHRAGVSCSDCHDPHSLQLKATGNALCAQCHSSEVFDVLAHHRHDADSPGGQCVNCHMPSRNYMVVDARRDHSFRIPRPDLSDEIDTPNACNDCHQDQSAGWAAAAVTAWQGAPPADTMHYGEILHAGRRGLAGAGAALVMLADDRGVAGIVRATAISLLATNFDPAAAGALARAAQADDPLLRTAAALTAQSLEPAARVGLLGPLLRDPVRAVRLQAVASLLPLPRSQLPSGLSGAYDIALEEYRAAQVLNADRAEAQVNLGNLNAAQGDLKRSVAAYARAVRQLPQFAPAYANMADMYRELGQEQDAEVILRRGIDAVPDSALLHHAVGLAMVRQQRYQEAIALLQHAHDLAPDNPRYAYVLGVALNSTGETARSLGLLRTAHKRRTGDRDLLFALATISRDSGDGAGAVHYARKLLALDPGDSGTRQLLRDLEVRFPAGTAE